MTPQIVRREAWSGFIASLDVQPITHWAISPDDRFLLVSGAGPDAGRVTCLDLDDGTVCAARAGATPVTALAWAGPCAWIVRGDGTLEVHEPPSARVVDVVALPGMPALRHHVSAGATAALVARAELAKAQRRDPAARVGWLVDRVTARPLQPIDRRELDPIDDVRVLGRHVATALSPDGAAVAAAFGPRIVAGGGLAPGPVATLELHAGRTAVVPRVLSLPAHEIAWAAGATLVLRAARVDPGAHDPEGRVLVVDVARARVIFDSRARATDPGMESEHHTATTHAVLHPDGDRIVVCGHAMYVPIVRGGTRYGSHVHSRAYVVAVADGATLRTLDLETNPWDAVGAQWRGDDLDVLTASGSRWGVARWTRDAAGAPAIFDHRGVLLGGRLHRSPRGTRHVITAELWPGNTGHLTLCDALPR